MLSDCYNLTYCHKPVDFCRLASNFRHLQPVSSNCSNDHGNGYLAWNICNNNLADFLHTAFYIQRGRRFKISNVHQSGSNVHLQNRIILCHSRLDGHRSVRNMDSDVYRLVCKGRNLRLQIFLKQMDRI